MKKTALFSLDVFSFKKLKKKKKDTSESSKNN